MLYQVINPATGATEIDVPGATDDDVDRTLDVAHAAYREWRRSTLAHRASLLQRASQLVIERRDELAGLVSREMGKTIRAALEETDEVADICSYYAEHGPALLADTPLQPRAGGTAYLRHDPVGALLGVMPWNYPYYQVARFAAPNLLVGNTVVIKPAPQCPLSAAALQDVFDVAGFPHGTYSTSLADNDQIERMIGDPRVAGVSVTGSERAGAAVAEIAGRHLKKVVLELGGSDPFIVLDTHDLDRTVGYAVAGRLENAGQACNAAKRIIVIDELYDDFMSRFTAAMAAVRTGSPTDPATDYGPLSSERALITLMEQIEDAVRQGATVHTGGHRVGQVGAFVAATVLSDVTPAMRAYHEELFGPVAVVYRVTSEDEAVSLANDTTFGLGGVVCTEDDERAARVAAAVDTGMIWINATQGSLADLPFGGTKRSGTGRELGELGLMEFVNRKLVYEPGRSR